MPDITNGYEPGTRPAERRAFFDLRRRIALLEDDGGGGANEVVISASDPIGTYPEAKIWIDSDAPSGAPIPAWNAVAFQNSWVNHAAPVSYRKIGDLVYLRGAANGNAATAGTVIFTLPVGYRPAQTQITATTCAGNTFGYVSVGTNGVVTMFGNKDYVSMDIPPFSVTL